MEYESFLSELSAMAQSGDVRYELNYPFSRISTLRMGGNIPCLVYPKNGDAMVRAVKICMEYGVKFRVIGNSSNIIPPDEVLIPAVISSRRMKGIYALGDGKTHLRVYAGEQLNSLIIYCMKNSLSGIEKLYGIPATVGGAAAMNAGAFGQSVSDCIVNIHCYDITAGKCTDVSASEAKYSYRESIFADTGKYVILCVDFKFSEDEQHGGVRTRAMAARRSKDMTQPTEKRSAGSIFRRCDSYPPPAYMIDHSSLKGFSIGGAEISKKHAGFMINKGNASENDFARLIEYTKKTVEKNFGAKMVCEVEFFDSN